VSGRSSALTVEWYNRVECRQLWGEQTTASDSVSTARRYPHNNKSKVVPLLGLSTWSGRRMGNGGALHALLSSSLD
jgi:hypothetical protein